MSSNPIKALMPSGFGLDRKKDGWFWLHVLYGSVSGTNGKIKLHLTGAAECLSDNVC